MTQVPEGLAGLRLRDGLAPAPDTQQRRGASGPWNSLSLFWRVFVMNALVLGLAFAGLVMAPVSVSVPVVASEAVVLSAGLLARIVHQGERPGRGRGAVLSG